MTNPTETRAPRACLYTRVTDGIVAALNQGVRPWLKPWTTGSTQGSITRPLRHNGERYRGINILTLWITATEKGYSSPYWLTFRQTLELGAHVRKGEHGSPVVYADHFTRTEANDQGDESQRDIPFLKSYTVFNADQIDGLPERFLAKPEAPRPLIGRIANADAFVKATGAEIEHGGHAAYYAPGLDRIQLPPFETFHNAEGYYATALHELTHWTGHAMRCHRDFSPARFGDEGYAREELVAELGAAFLCADLGLAPEARDDHAAYIAHWLRILQNDKRAIFQAAAHAQRAADFLHDLQQETPL